LSAVLAECFAEMLHTPVPTVSVVIGESGSDGALCLGIADRFLMLQYSACGVIAPEGAAAILYRNAKRAEDRAISVSRH